MDQLEEPVSPAEIVLSPPVAFLYPLQKLPLKTVVKPDGGVETLAAITATIRSPANAALPSVELAVVPRLVPCPLLIKLLIVTGRIATCDSGVPSGFRNGTPGAFRIGVSYSVRVNGVPTFELACPPGPIAVYCRVNDVTDGRRLDANPSV